ncbi:hypothetical protein V7S43_011008 [Phytophthora oleae]|uniref:Uncharacterized protein n=1 Tax=Phytophthora oleae TaxID=2107226 RepID=A0ABD3FCV5_9STRA
MERKVLPPRGFGGPPVVNGAQPQPFQRRNGPPLAFGGPPAANSEQNAPPPPPQQPQSLGFQAPRGPVNTNVGVAGRGWKPGRVGGRHDSPLYGKHRKRPSSSSIDSNVSWSGSEIESLGGFGAAHTEEQSRLSWASSVATKEEAPSAAQHDLAPAASLFGAPAHEQQPQPAYEIKPAVAEAGMAVQPPKTPLGKPTQDDEGEISAVQRVRMGLSVQSGSRAGSRANSSENVFANSVPPVYDEEKSGPQSCPSTFNNTKQPQFSIDKLRQLRSNELVASKLLPTRTSVNSLMGYVRELQLSEATLRKQLVTTKQHTEEELSQSLSKVTELERTMHEVERDREMARRKLEEQEQLIRDLAAKLKQAEAAKATSSAISALDELPSIAEEAISHTETEVKTTATDGSKSETTNVFSPAAISTDQSLPPASSQRSQPPMLPVHRDQPNGNRRAAQFGLASPRSPNRPLWDPWASGGVTPMKNLPPAFTIGSTGLDPVVASSTSTTEASTTDVAAPGEYELKSVLMSPRRDQVQDENVHADQQMNQTEFPQEEFAPQYSVGAMPPPLYPQQQDFSLPEAQNEAYGMQDQEDVPLMESPSQAVPMLPAEKGTLTNDNLPVQQGSSSLSAQANVTDASAGEWNEIPAQKEVFAPAVPFLQSVDIGESENMVPPPSTVADQSTLLPSQAMGDNNSPEMTLPRASVQLPPPGAEAENAEASIPAAPPVDSIPLSPPQTSDVQPPRPASPAQQEIKTVPTEPVSLETLLVDFFTEVDNKRLKMAKVYGKRYEGREKWLFAELSKRYGASKVAALKTRYENSSSSEASATSSSGSSDKMSDRSSKPTDVSKSDRPKAGRQGHPRHPQFFHPPTPANSVDVSAGNALGPPPASVSQDSDTPIAEADQDAEGSGTTAVSSDKASPGRAASVSPRQRRSGGNVPPFATAPPSFPGSEGTGEGNDTSTVGPSGPPVMNSSRPSIPREEPARQFNKHPPPPPFQARRENTSMNNINNDNAEPMGLRQRHNAPRPSAQGQKTDDAEPPAVTLEGLLKELYKKHQPDKLKNVSIVAKQYAGKERELVGLLKGKYGALSVKHLEENLEVLERAHVARMAGKGAGKKRSCVVRTVSLVFWVSVVLYFSFGAVFVSFVVLDAWECHSLDSDEQELESDECAPLKKELETFTYEHIADYVSQSHPDSCFCSEWKARESALFANLSGDDLMDLVRLVPFSPESFGALWIASVKEQVPSQEFYDSYAKPVVDVSLDVGSFLWSSVVELAGYDEASEPTSEAARDVVENDTESTPLMDEEVERDAYLESLEQASEVAGKESSLSDAEADNVLSEDVKVDAGSAAISDTLAQVPAEEEVLIEEEASKIDDALRIDETDVAAKDEVSLKDSAGDEESTTTEEEGFSSVEDVVSIVEESATVDEENASSAEDVISEEEESVTVENKSSSVASTFEDEEEATVESIDPVEPENVPGAEETELVDTSEEPAEAAEAADDEVTETVAEDVSIEDSIVEESVTADEENASSAEDVISEEEESVTVENKSSSVASTFEDEEEATVESIDPVEPENVPGAEETELVDTSEEPAEATDGAATETMAEDASVVVAIVDNDHVVVDDDDAEVSVASEGEVAGGSVDIVEDVSDAASVKSGELSGEKNAQSDDVVEVEVRQEGLDLLYPEMDEAKEDSTVEASSFAVEEASEPAVNTDGDESLHEAEPESVVESEDVSVDAVDESHVVEEDLATSSATDVDVAEPASADVENATEEEELAESEDLDMEASPELSQDWMSVTEDAGSDLMDANDVDEVQVLEDNEGAETEEVEDDGSEEEDESEEELDALIDVEVMVFNEEGAVSSDKNDASVLVSEDTNVAEVAIEVELPTTSSSDIDGEEPLSDESSESMPTEAFETISEEDHNATGSVDDVDEDEDDENVEVVASNDEDESVVPVETEAVIFESMVEDDGVSESDDEAVEELAEKTDNEAEGGEEVVGVSFDIELATEEGGEVGEPSVSSETEAESANVDGMVNEDADVGNDEAEVSTPREIKAEQSASEVDLFSELAGDESVAIEATEASVDADAASVEEISALVDLVDSEEVEGAVGTESAVVADVEARDSAEASAVPAAEEGAVVDTNDAAVAVDMESAEELSNTDTDEEAAADDEGDPEQEVEEASTFASEDEENGGLVSVVNDVLARLVEPFEAAKTAMPVVESEEEV